MLRSRIFAGVLLLLISSCGSHHNPRRKQKDAAYNQASRSCGAYKNTAITRGLPGEPQTLDPQKADDEFSFQVLRDLYEGLTDEDPQGNIVPGVAKSWRVSKKGTVYTFRLRRNARWSDGTQVTAQQFVSGLRRAVDPRTASGSAELLDEIKGAKSIIAGTLSVSALGVKAIGDTVLKVDLDNPAPYILQVLSQPIAAPLRIEDSQPAHVVNPGVTDGAFVLGNWLSGSYLDLNRNPFYWNVGHIAVPEIRYLITGSEATELNEYLAGQLDITYSIPMPDLQRMLKDRASQVQMAPILATFYLAYNMSEPSLKNNIKLRQALSMAIDRRLITQKVMFGVDPAFSFVPSGVQNYRPPKYRWANWPRERRLSYARMLLARAGYSNGRKPDLRLYFNNDETVRRVVLAIAENWKRNLGVSVRLISDDFRVFLVRRKNQHLWDIARFGWSADYDDAASFLDVFANDSAQNDGDYSDKKFSNFMNAARIEPNVNKRRKMLENAESTLLNDYAVIPIYFYQARRLVKPCIGGATITPLSRTYSKFLFWKKSH